MRRLSTTRAALLLACGATALLLLAVWPYLSSAAFLFDLSGSTSALRAFVPVRAAPVQARDLEVATRHGQIAARLYAPDDRVDRAIVVVPGVHGGGVDEPRLDRLSRRLAGAGAAVLTVPLPDLREYRVLARSTDMIEDAARWFADERGRGERVGLIGVSFSGGLAVVAAGRPALRDRLTAVVSVGGHGDLPRALRYLCTGTLPDGTARRPHEYGVAVLLRGALPELVPPPQIAAVDRALVAYLDAASLAATDPDRAARLIDESLALSRAAGATGEALMRLVHARDVERLGARLLPWLEDIAGDPALSPERSPAPAAPVFLLHGEHDNVIPSTETPLLAAHLRVAGNAPVRALLTPMVSHADVLPGASLTDRWRLVRMWTAIWRQFSP